MQKNLVIAGGAAAAVAIVLGVTLSGVLVRSVDGAPVANEATRALQGINTASLSLADAPAATYDGTVTMKLNSKSLTLDVTKLTVTSAGDVHGTVRENGGSAELLQIANRTLVKGDAEFWRKQETVKQPAGVFTESSPTGKWVSVKEEFLGVDLRAALRPSRLGLALGQQDATLGDSDVSGTDIGRGSKTPDRRVNPGTDRPGAAEIDVEDADGGVQGTRRFQAGAMVVGTDDDGALTALRGPIGKGFGGDLAQVDADLRVTRLDAAGAHDFYSTAKTAVSAGNIGSATMIIPNPTGGLDCSGMSCTIDYGLANTGSGLDSGTVTIAVATDFKSGGRAAGQCSGTSTMPINGRGNARCTIASIPYGDINSSTKFNLTVSGAIDPVAIDTAVTKGNSVADSAKGWTMTSPKAAETSRMFNRQVALAPSGYAFTVGGFGFDGRETDGTLLIVNGPGYEAHVLPTNAFDPAWPGTEQILSQARDAHAAAGAAPVRMVFAELRAADAARALLAADNVQGVEVVFVQAYSRT